VDTLTVPARTWHFPTARTIMLDNGLRLRLIDMPGKFVATVAVTMAIPTEIETADTEGVVAAWTAMLMLDAPFARGDGIGSIARIGAGVTSGCDHRGPKVIADCPVTELGTLFDALAAAVLALEPTQRSFDLVRGRRTAELGLETHDSFALANKLLNASVLAPASRYARSVSGTAHSWARLDLADVVELQQARVDPQHVTVVVVGDLAVLDVAAAAEAAFAPYPSRGLPPAADRAPERGSQPVLSCRPDQLDEATQTQVMLGCFAIDRLDSRWPSARVLGEMLGGGVDGLLDAELRGRRGLTYGLDVKFLPYYQGGLFTVAGKVDAARSEHAISVIMDMLHRVHTGRLDPRHYARVRDRMVRSAPETYESTLAVAQQYVELDSCGIGAGFIDAHLDQLRALDLDRVRADAATLLDPASMHAAIVGRFDPDASVLASLPRC
jgi:zinc protease